tara:strand:+ start:28 stop:2724 length:2697 start_codon:yes stop_codon:yes gene_type:complete
MPTTKYIDIKLRTKSAETSADKLDGKMKGLGTTVDKTSNSFGVLSKVAAAVGTAIVTGQITRYADAYTSLQNQVRQTTKSTEGLTQRTKDLLDISNRSRAGISSTSELYTQLVLSTESLNLSTDEQLRLTETITKSFVVSGKSAADAAGSIRQLGQAFASGTLRGDEFNSIAEGAPEIMRALQRSLNLTQGELRDLAATGGITAKILVDALGEAAEVIDNKFNDSTATMAQNIEVANNNLTEFIGSSTTVQNVIGGLGGAIVTASENIEDIAKGAALIASVFAAKLIPSILATTKAKLALVTASAVSAKASVAEASSASAESIASKKLAVEKAIQAKETLQLSIAKKAATTESVILARATANEAAASLSASKEAVKLERLNVKRGATSQVLAQKIQLRTNATLQAVAADKALATAETAVSVSSQKLAASKTAASIAIANTTKAKAASATASATLTTANAAATRSSLLLASAARAATTAMTFLGGPLGIALIAATALYTFGDSVTDLNGKVSTATPEMDAFAASIEKMSRGAKGASLANINNKMTALRATLTETQAKLDGIKVQNSGGLYDKSTIEAAKYRVKIKEINDQLDLLSQKQGIIVGAPDLSNGTNRGDINKEQAKTTVTSNKQSQFSINLAQETEALQIELALRQQVEQGYLSQRDADLSASFVVDNLRRTKAFEAELLLLGTNEEAKVALTEQFKANQILREQLYQDQLVGIEQEASEKRKSIAQKEAEEKQAFYDGLLSTGINFGAALLKNEISSNAKSEKEKKRARKKGVLIDTAAGIARAFADHNFYVALGMSAAIAANGLTQISAINSASSVSAPTTSGSSTQAPTTPSANQQTPIRNRTVDIRTDGSAFSEAVKGAALALFNSGDDDVVLNITNAQNELIRTGGAG